MTPAPIAFVGLDRQVYVARGDIVRPLTSALPRSTAAWGMLQSSAESWSWPTWSPDGRWVAAFSVEGGDQDTGPARVRALSADGIREEEWAEVRGASPLYLHWHPKGDALGVLVQSGEELQLGLVRRDRLGELRPVEHGVPLFFNWTPDGARVLLHVGGARGGDGRLVLRDPFGDAPDVPFDAAPGSFCAPVFAGDRAVWAARRGVGSSELTVSAWDGADPVPGERRRGLVALLGAPGGAPLVAASHAPGGEGTPYKGVELLDVRTGVLRTLTEHDCLAFFWSPDGTWLLFAEVDREGNCLTWYRLGLDGSAPVPLATFWPTRDLLFFLHFFDQYASSHSLLSPDGRHLVYTGYPAGGGSADLSSPPRVWVKDVSTPDAPPVELGRGSFAVFSPVG